MLAQVQVCAVRARNKLGPKHARLSVLINIVMNLTRQGTINPALVVVIQQMDRHCNEHSDCMIEHELDSLVV